MSSKAKRQRGKAAAKAPPKKGTKRARDEDKADKFAESVLASVTCPISHSLVVQPVVAEDGQVYERERIETWLQKKETSPFTRKPMGTQLVDSVASRSIVASAIENGLVDAEAATACVEINQCVGCTENSSLSHFAATTWPRWLGRATRNRHRHAIEQAPRRWRGGRRDERAVKF